MPFRNLNNHRGSHLVGVGIDITEACNRRCPTCFCYRSSRQMTADTYRLIVDQAVKTGFTELYVLGGEPTLHPDILEFMRYASGKFEQFILVTNMDFLAERSLCARIADLGVSIAGQRHALDSSPEARELEALLSGDARWLETSHQAWANVADIFPPERVIVQCCITRPVVESGKIFDVFRWARQQDYEPVMEFTKEGTGFKRDDVMDISPEQLLRVLTELQRIDVEEFGRDDVQILCPQAYGKTCHMTENSVHFLVDGTAVPCVGHARIPYGNILTDGMDAILSHPWRQVFQHPEEWVYGYCRDECPHFGECAGGCRGSAFDMTGCPRASFFYCPHIPRDRLSLADMLPPTCKGCPLEKHAGCQPRIEP